MAVVDPHAEHISDYLAIAEQAGSPIVAIFETHVQVDHLSGAVQLAAETDAPIYLHESANVNFSFTPLHDGDVIELGNDYVQVMHTPGHSPDSVCLVVGDRVRSEAPWLVFTGDTLFVGDVGRPDLHGDASRYAGLLYDSLFNKLLNLDNTVEIYPSHFAGSACGRAMSGKPSSTIGFEKRFNAALQHKDKADFIIFVQQNQVPAPAEFTTIRQANVEGQIGTPA
ncbi:MAG: MBL fold metallo-hydrolase [Chloroflexi bacterium]|nr:MBL fold metallo-hydrolase [Chloroflexota bacterium]